MLRRPRATATPSLPAAPATDSAATVRVEVTGGGGVGLGGDGFCGMELSLKNRFYCSGLP